MGNSELRVIVEREQKVSGERLLNWCLWKLLLPLVVICALYPIYLFVLDLDYPFERAFAHGDLILFSVLILLEAAIEGEHIKNHSTLFHLGLGSAKVAAVIFMLAYGVIKADVVRREHEMALAKDAIAAATTITTMEKLAYYSYFNWIVAALAVSWSLAAFWKVVGKEQEERLTALAGE